MYIEPAPWIFKYFVKRKYISPKMPLPFDDVLKEFAVVLCFAEQVIQSKSVFVTVFANQKPWMFHMKGFCMSCICISQGMGRWAIWSGKNLNSLMYINLHRNPHKVNYFIGMSYSDNKHFYFYIAYSVLETMGWTRSGTPWTRTGVRCQLQCFFMQISFQVAGFAGFLS